MDTMGNHQPVDIEAIVKQIVGEMLIGRNANDSPPLSADNANQSNRKKKKKKRKDDSKKKTRRPNTKTSKRDRGRRLRRTGELVGTIEKLVSELEDLRKERREEGTLEIPGQIMVDDGRRLSVKTVIGYDFDDDLSEVSASDRDASTSDDEITTSTTSRASLSSTDFYKAVAARLKSQNGSICIQGDFVPTDEEIRSDQILSEDYENAKAAASFEDFDAAFGPEDMRCLALVSHNEMKSTMRDFVIHHKHILKKFRLTGTQSTMKMLGEVFADEPGIVFGPSCQSGPLGGDAELVALMTRGELGGILFFQDPMSCHPHQADIQCLVRQAMVHNTLIATTPTTAMTIMEVFRSALRGGRPELIPSFFFSLQSPTVDSYKNAQKLVINRCSTVTFCDTDTVHT